LSDDGADNLTPTLERFHGSNDLDHTNGPVVDDQRIECQRASRRALQRHHHWQFGLEDLPTTT